MRMRRGIQRKPRKLVLSPTRISTYLACRVMYKYTYIDHIGRFYYQPKAYHSFGASLHRTLERFHEAGGAETQDPEQLVESLHKLWTSSGYSSVEEETEHLEEAGRLLRDYHAVCEAEGAKTLATEKVLRIDMGEFDLTGRVDRLDEHPDGRIDVVDYKSGRLEVTQEEVRDDLAMGIYAYLAHRSFTGRPISATIYCLRTGNRATVEFTQEDLAEVEDGVRAIAEEIMRIDEDSVIEPVWLPYVCPGCDYLRLCAHRMNWNVPELMAETREGC